MKVWVSRDHETDTPWCTGDMVVSVGEKPVPEHGQWCKATGKLYKLWQESTADEFENLYGIEAPATGSCKQMELTLTEIKP